MSYRYYSDTAAQTTLINGTGIDDVTTTLIVNDPTGLPCQLGHYPFVLRVEPNSSSEELVLVTSGSGTFASPFTMTRAYGTTTARPHANGVQVHHGLCSVDLKDSRDHEATEFGTHGDIYVRKTTNLALTNNATLQDDAELFTPVASRHVYTVELSILYLADAAIDLKIGFSAPGGATYDWTLDGLDPAATSSTGSTPRIANTIADTQVAGGAGVSTRLGAYVCGHLIVDVAGNFKFRWAQNVTSGTATTVLLNSYLCLRCVGLY